MYGFCNSCDQKRRLIWDKQAQEWVCKECIGQEEPLNTFQDRYPDEENPNQSFPDFTVRNTG